MRFRISFVSKAVIYSLALFLLGSCASQQRYVYLEDMIPNQTYDIIHNKQTTVRQGDRLIINVSSNPPELAIPFNNMFGNVNVSERGEITSIRNSGNSNNPNGSKRSFLVNSDGNIDFPVLGLLHVDGLTIDELSKMIKLEIINGDYIKEPIVTAEFANLRYYTLGAISNKGLQVINDDRITLLEAISLSGDITQGGRADKVFVIRRNGDSNQIFEHDLQSSSIFASPAFYLQQNDIIYVESRKQMRNENVDNVARYITLAVSTVTSVITLIVLLNRK